jgi:2-C-methyl-D-erythritol 4-phosphate cytidylyltransferase
MIMFDAIIVMAGRGERAKQRVNKVFYKIQNKYIFLHSVDTLLSNNIIQKVILVVNSKDLSKVRRIMKSYDSSRYEITLGGETRQESVYQGLQKVTAQWVLIHDGARPFVSYEAITLLIDAIKQYKVATLGQKASDTYKVVNQMMVEGSVDRDQLYAMHTPQGGETAILLDCHEKAKRNQFFGTDDISIVQKYSKQTIAVVESNQENIKITTPLDFIIAKAIAHRRKP